MKIKILTECSNEAGLGHISRCSSLYDEISSRGIDVEMIVFGDTDGINFLKDKQVINENWINKDFLRVYITNKDYVIMDSYKANKEIYEVIASLSKKALYIDDNNRIDYPDGVIVQPSLSKGKLELPTNNFLFGSKYIILRSDFLKAKEKIIRKDIKKILVIMGGTDPVNATQFILEELCQNNQNISFDVVLGRAQKNLIEKKLDYKNVNYYTNLDAQQMRDIMLEADLSITAAGQTIHELIFTKTPFIAVQTMDNQIRNSASIRDEISPDISLRFEDELFSENLKNVLEKIKDINFRNDLIIKMDKLIDGKGSKRIIDSLFENSNSENTIQLRKAKKHDTEDIFELSNQGYVREYSINKNIIQWNDHVKWFNSTIDNENNIFYVITDNKNDFLGQVRYKLIDSFATISVSFHEKIKGKGLSKMIISESIVKLLEEKPLINEIVAIVSENNKPSKKLFEDLNFEKEDKKSEMIRFILRRGSYNENWKF